MMIVIQMSLGIKLKRFAVSSSLREKKNKMAMTMFSVLYHIQRGQKMGQNMMIVNIHEIQVKDLLSNQILIEVTNPMVEVDSVMKKEEEVQADPEMGTERGAEVDQEMETGTGAGADPEMETGTGAGVGLEMGTERGAGVGLEMGTERGAGADPEMGTERGAVTTDQVVAVIDQEVAPTDQAVAVTQSEGEVQLLL